MVAKKQEQKKQTPKIERVTIRWEEKKYAEISDAIKSPFYLLAKNSKPLYLGIAYKMQFKTEIDQNIERLGIPARGLMVWVGTIESSTYDRITREIVLSAECLMIFINDSINKNSDCTKNYNIDTHRNNFKVISHDCPYLKAEIKVEKNKFYYKTK